MLERRTSDGPYHGEHRRSGRDRRVELRYSAGGTAVVLSWLEGAEYRTIPAILRDISLGGGSVFTEEPPPQDVPVWFRLRSDDRSEWVGATIVGLSKTGLLGRGPRLVRLKFRDSCPYQIFKTAIEGFSQEVKDDEFAMGGFRKRGWLG